MPVGIARICNDATRVKTRFYVAMRVRHHTSCETDCIKQGLAVWGVEYNFSWGDQKSVCLLTIHALFGLICLMCLQTVTPRYGQGHADLGSIHTSIKVRRNDDITAQVNLTPQNSQTGTLARHERGRRTPPTQTERPRA